MKFQPGNPKPPGSGRKKGTPNKATEFSAKFIMEFLTKYKESGLMESDFEGLDPKDRLALAEKFANYIVPKRQAVQAEVESTNKHSIEETLLKLAGEDS